MEALIRQGQASGSVRAEIDAESEAQRLVILIDGLSLRARFDPWRYSRERLSEIVDGELDRLVAPPGSSIPAD